jgi:LysR family transcriptional regulator, nitrogen assimilation regulatory protein
MQLRHLRYFVKIVEAGSFSRAAATIHVAQPALSQQIAELEEQLGVNLLLRSARGVRPTVAGEILYREASTILRLVENLPGVVRSESGETEGTISVGMSSTLAATLAGSFIEACKSALPQVVLKLAVADSHSIKSRVQAQTLDMAAIFEDEFVPIFVRKPLFRQRLFLVSREPLANRSASVSCTQVAALPLVLPSPPNVLRVVVDRAFAAAGVAPKIMAEADVLSGILSMVQAGIGSTILPMGDLSDVTRKDMAMPLLIEPPLFLTASVISSGDFPLTHAGEAVRNVLTRFIESHLTGAEAPGAEWIG